ncbi:RHH-type proline utilization regulon transcriptional repressor/proline dehydrogenase/delta 1-pyrroline-5-carboxylate dehydrogenase [Rhodovulum iodosum]|uniref:Bifunctional protein PutA n=1 Tax=Rhodovulum iodosum TaxID=68291 RepID=A0ABV3XPF9_9RHOB|nr:bifunctional proline dehydrogenase/L-glutamate gamma-semialdehyde dehydrogenase PutA [Rhodovulum robiginosum]RSK31502.1 bifunctional proline dehydrogenase/L-glutamate gamma-semialdehyde dehydrogenase PutA [Rhodovulum robiginosum]
MSPDTMLAAIENETYADEGQVLARLIDDAALAPEARARIAVGAADLVRAIRETDQPGLMEVFLAEYGLSTEEGIALMCLAEALLRVPDAETMDALIEDKIAPSDWGRHLGKSASPLVNASTWALMLTGRVLEKPEPGLASTLRGAVKRLGEPVIRTAVGRAMREMGRQFVLGETIQAAMDRASGMEAKGYTYSYDMLGEAARTMADADRYMAAYSAAIAEIGTAATSGDVRSNPGISVKLSALHPRYEVAQRGRVMDALAPRLLVLALQAKEAGMGLNVDAEEADRLSLSLEVIARVVRDPRLAGWDGFGVVVQAYGQRAGQVIDWLYRLAEEEDRRFMVRLVKGAYWDTEIKRAQVEGVDGFPVFTRKAATDVSYLANARKLLGMTDRLYPQFATHNAHSVTAILQMGADRDAFEFQRLHGMGETLHDLVMRRETGSRCRIYAPVGAHRDLLAYLVRRLLENGANSSFVNQIVDEAVPPEEVAADPFAEIEAHLGAPEHPAIRRAPALFGPGRRNSRGWDLAHGPHLDEIEAARAPHRAARFDAAPLIAGTAQPETAKEVENPADPSDIVGHVAHASPADVEAALAAARRWEAPAAERAETLRRAADLYEDAFGPIFAIVAREAGKSLPDAVGELREAVDFLRFYADEGEAADRPARGLFACISPWNFPLAIFTGQIAAALAAGNGVLAKPAEQTPLIAHFAVGLLHRAGVPRSALQLLPGDGPTVGAALTSDARIDGVAFTGSTDTAQAIRRAMADTMAPGTPLIAETGGLNAMIVDSTALPEQAVRDILASAFQSAGQRCSALRCLYVQEDIAEGFQKMLFGAMAELTPGDPWSLSTDTGPLIDADAKAQIAAYVEAARGEGRVLWQGEVPAAGHFLAPVAVRVGGIEDLDREVFGPVLHIATYRAEALDTVIDAINAKGYGLTFGLHSRIDDRVQHVAERLKVGNLYVNRNQIGAIVGSQPFGGEGLSGTGPKAGGPDYLARFTAGAPETVNAASEGQARPSAVQAALDAAAGEVRLDALPLPGPTGESNRLSRFTRPPLLCLGPGRDAADRQRAAVEALGGRGVAVHGALPPEALSTLTGLGGALWWGDAETGRACERALARRDGPILPLITEAPDAGRVRLERHLCIDTTASGGNAALLAEVGSA